MKWLLPAGIVFVTSALGIIPAWREQRHPISRVAMVTCAEDAGNEAAGSPSQTLRFQLAEETPDEWAHVTADQLVEWGFDRADSNWLHQTKPTGIRWPSVRTVWARLRPDSLRGGRLAIEAMGRTRAGVWRDTTSIVARIRLGWDYRPVPRVSSDTTASPHQTQERFVFHFGTLELIPWSLHITAEEDRAIRQVNAGRSCRGSTARAVIANGPDGGLWIERVISQ